MKPISLPWLSFSGTKTEARWEKPLKSQDIFHQLMKEMSFEPPQKAYETK
jgi:hypothetical protein